MCEARLMYMSETVTRLLPLWLIQSISKYSKEGNVSAASKCSFVSSVWFFIRHKFKKPDAVEFTNTTELSWLSGREHTVTPCQPLQVTSWKDKMKPKMLTTLSIVIRLQTLMHSRLPRGSKTYSWISFFSFHLFLFFLPLATLAALSPHKAVLSVAVFRQ